MTGQDKTSLVTTRDDFTSQGCSRPTCYRRESLLKRSLYRRAARRVERDAPAYRAERSVTEERVRSRRTDELTEQRKPPTTSRRVEAADNTGPRRWYGTRRDQEPICLDLSKESDERSPSYFFGSSGRFVGCLRRWGRGSAPGPNLQRPRGRCGRRGHTHEKASLALRLG